MTQQGGLLEKAGEIVLILALMYAGFFCFGSDCWAIDHIVISEVQITGGTGKTKNDFIEFYNPTDASFNLKGHRLVKRTKTGDKDTSIKSWTSDALIPGHGYYLWANSADGFADSLNADVSTTQTIANDNGIALRFGKADEGEIIDSVGWGNCENIFIEGSVFSTNPGANQSLERKLNVDTDNNSTDFFIQDVPNPQNSGGSEPEPEFYCGDGSLDEGEECDDGNNEDGDGCSALCIIEYCGDGIVNGFLEECDDGNNEDGDGCSADCQVEEGEGEEEEEEEEEEGEETTKPIIHKLGEIVVNEFVSDPADGEVEWIELYNTTNGVIDLNNWIIEEGSGAKTSLEGSLAGSGDSKFIVIEKPKGNLNNKGDIIILRDDSGTLIDQVVYGNWDDSSLDNNAPAAEDPFSVARRFDGHNTYNNINDFAITTTLTKGESNVITSPKEEEAEEISVEERARYDYSNDIIISEIFSNPVGSDSPSAGSGQGEGEFIELFNKGEREVNLLGWRLGDESKKRYKIANLSEFNTNVVNANIKPREYLVIYRSESKIALNNGSDSVKLFQPLKDEPLQIVKYEKAIEGWSYNNTYIASSTGSSCRFTSQDDRWVWSEIVTPGAVNEIKTVNHLPLVDFDCPEEILIGMPIVFDSSDTVDEDGDELQYFWDFGDTATNTLPCPEHTYFQVGAFTVKLTVSDGENEVEKEKIISVVDSLEGDGANLAGPHRFADASLQDDGGIIISEFLPDPEGSDLDGEWIELYNQGGTEINLLNWRLDDIEGGSRPFTFLDDSWFKAGKYLVLDRAESKIALNNSNEAVRLFSDLGELIDEVEYEKAIEGESYARGINNKWFWTTALTPGKENIISVADSESVIKVTRSLDSKTKKTREKVVVEISLEKVKEMEVGDLIKIAGTVAVLPGVLGSQYFYIVGSPGIQVYNYKKDFPNLQVGDYIEVNGELSMSNGEWRLKTKQADDIKVVEHREAPTPEPLTCEKVDEDNTGQLITVTGEVVERKSSLIYLDDGTDEILVYIKKSTGIDARSIKEGEIITVTGLVSRTKTGIRIMPRFRNDIIKKDPESQAGEVGQVLGQVAVSDEWAMAQRDKKLELFKHLLILAGGVIIILSGLLIKARA